MTNFTYILAQRPHGPIYVGSARDLRQRVEQHRTGNGSVHTSKYKIYTLVWFEKHARVQDAISRERQIKPWKRVWKDALIEEINPEWRDLCDQIPF